MKRLTIEYVAAVYPITCCTGEEFTTRVSTIRELIEELEERYGGFREMFVDPKTGGLNLNTMIYYGDREAPSSSALDLDRKISDGGRITFW